MRYLRQSTAATVIVGPFLSPSDGVTPVTGVASPAGRLVANGAGSAWTPASWSHDANGHYLAGFSTSDTGAVGRLRVEFSSPGAYVPVWEDFSVLAGPVYDALFGDSALATAALLPANLAALGITAGGKISEVALVDTLTTYSGNTPQTGDSYAALQKFAGLQLTGQVAASPAPTATGFTVTLDAALSGSTVAADLQSLYCSFRSGAREGTYRQVAACTINSTTSVSLTFAAAYAAAPAAGDLVSISG